MGTAKRGTPAVTPRKARTTDTVAAVANELRLAIMHGDLSPGEKIRQDALAEQLGVSRIPVREALKILAANGLLEYTMNFGFAVARLNESDFSQLYRLRRLIEDELTTPLPAIDKEQEARLNAISRQLVAASSNLEIVEMVNLNREFHFAIFELSGLSLMIDIVSRLWDLAAPYHSTYLYDPRARQRVIKEQRVIIQALKRGDQEAYRLAMADHRAATEAQLRMVLRQPVPFGRLQR